MNQVNNLRESIFSSRPLNGYTFEVTLASKKVKRIVISDIYATQVKRYLHEHLKKKKCKNYNVKYLGSSPLRKGVIEEVKVR